MPGLGQIHAGTWRLGVILLVISATGAAIIRVITWFRPEPTTVGCWLALGAAIAVFDLGAAIDAARRTRRTPRHQYRPWVRSTWLAAATMLLLSIGIATAIPLRWRVFSIPSGSMAPTLLVGDYLVAMIQQPSSRPGYGDVVVFRVPRDPAIYYVKRVVGLAGDRIRMINGQLFINDHVVGRQAVGTYALPDTASASVQRYLETLPGGLRHDILKESDDGRFNNTGVYRVPDGCVFVLGDNRDNSIDSRMLNAIGYIPLQYIAAQAGVVYWARDFQRMGERV
jgi:signal peptidase I